MLSLHWALTGRWNSRAPAGTLGSVFEPGARPSMQARHLVGSGRAPCLVLQAWSTTGLGSVPVGRGVGASLCPRSAATNDPLTGGLLKWRHRNLKVPGPREVLSDPKEVLSE